MQQTCGLKLILYYFGEGWERDLPLILAVVSRGSTASLVCLCWSPSKLIHYAGCTEELV